MFMLNGAFLHTLSFVAHLCSLCMFRKSCFCKKKPRQNLTASSNILLGSWILWARNSFRAVLHDIWGFFWNDLNDWGVLKYLVAWIIRDFFTYIFGTCSGVTCRLCSVETFNWRPICGLSKGWVARGRDMRRSFTHYGRKCLESEHPQWTRQKL